MNRYDYLKQLENLLQDINEDDRKEALDYYQSYFDEAGEENEQEVIETLGSVEQLASIIKDGLNNDFEQDIEIGDEGITHNKYNQKHEIQEIKQKINKKDLMIFVILFLCLCVPISSILNSIFGIAGVLFYIILFFFGFWMITFALYVIGSILIAAGILNILSYLGAGLIFIGIGLILIAIGELTGKLSSYFFKEFLPKLFKRIKDWISTFVSRRAVS